jgi:S1-C subfamily serine protease
MRGSSWILRVVALTLGPSLPTQAQAPNPEEALKRLTLPELVREVSPGIVHVASLGRQGKATNLGSGFVADPAGVIVTSYHLLRGAEGAMVKTSDGEVYDRVEVLEYDIRRDLLILKIRPFSPLHALRLAQADRLSLGDDVAAVGNPQGLENSVSSGIVSGHRQAEGYRLIQTTAPVSPGSSGSPLLNMHGEVIGLISSQLAAERSQNLNFALPVVYIRQLLEARNTPIPVGEFTRNVAQSPLAALQSGGSMDTRANAGESIWRVLHDHSRFVEACAGELRIGADSLAFFSSSNPAENWRMPFGLLVTAAKNTLYATDRKAFHIRLKDDRNYNYVLLTPEGRFGEPAPFLSELARARQLARP